MLVTDFMLVIDDLNSWVSPSLMHITNSFSALLGTCRVFDVWGASGIIS